MEPNSFEDRYDWAVLYRLMRQTLSYLRPDLPPQQLNTLADALAHKTVGYLQPFMRDYEAVGRILASQGYEVPKEPGEFNRMSSHLQSFIQSLTGLDAHNLEALAELLDQFDVPYRDAEDTLLDTPARIRWLGGRLARSEQALAEAMESQTVPSELLQQMISVVQLGGEATNRALAAGLAAAVEEIVAHTADAIAAQRSAVQQRHQEVLGAIEVLVQNQEQLPHAVRQALFEALDGSPQVTSLSRRLEELISALQRERTPDELIEEVLPGQTALQVQVDEALRMLRSTDLRTQEMAQTILLQSQLLRERVSVAASSAPRPSTGSPPPSANPPADPMDKVPPPGAMYIEYVLPIWLTEIFGFWETLNTDANGRKLIGKIISGYIELALAIIAAPLLIPFILYRRRVWGRTKKLIYGYNRRQYPGRVLGPWWLPALALGLAVYAFSGAMMVAKTFSGPLPTGFAGWVEQAAYRVHAVPVEDVFTNTSNAHLADAANSAFNYWADQRGASINLEVASTALIAQGALYSDALIKEGYETYWQRLIQILKREAAHSSLNAPLERKAADSLQTWLSAPKPSQQITSTALHDLLVVGNGWVLRGNLAELKQELLKSEGGSGRLNKAGPNRERLQQLVDGLRHSGAMPGSVGAWLDPLTARILQGWLTGYLPPTVPDRLGRMYNSPPATHTT